MLATLYDAVLVLVHVLNGSCTRVIYQPYLTIIREGVTPFSTVIWAGCITLCADQLHSITDITQTKGQS